MDLEEAKNVIDEFLRFCQGRYIGRIEFKAEASSEPVAIYFGADVSKFIAALETLNREAKSIELLKAIRELTQAIKDLRHNIPTRLALYTEERK